MSISADENCYSLDMQCSPTELELELEDLVPTVAMFAGVALGK
jgi:hypothetical protein